MFHGGCNLIGFGVGADPVFTGSYGANIATGQTYTSSSNETGSSPANAFNGSTAAGNTTNAWAAGIAELGAGANGVSYLRVQFGSASRIMKCRLFQGNDGSSNLRYVTSALWQWSDDGTSWTTAATHNSLTANSWMEVTFADQGSHVYWRCLANSDVGVADTWIVNEIEMMEGIFA